MRYLVLLALGLAACGGKSKLAPVPSLPTPTTKATSEMAEGDLDLRPVAVAAAGYYKRITSSARLGFNGVFLDQLELPRLTDEVVRHHNFLAKPRVVCTFVVAAPAGQRPTGPPAGTPQNCRMEGADAAFSLNAFRRVADTVYVGGVGSEVRSGSPSNSEVCLVMVWRDTAWTGAGKKGVSSRSCGR